MTRKSSADAALRRALLGWFRRYGRALPWRDAPSAYAIWVSEIMLQQTQVDTVIPYFHRFMERFPTVEQLAKAPLERVLQIWSGLGYYRRARLMHRAAQEMVARFGSQFPAEYGAARSLPGVGDYTARAVLSIAYNQPFTVFDGNVARVMARLHALSGNIHQNRFRQAVEELLGQMLSRRRPGEFNQALMQLGQLVCTPFAPHCAICPLRKSCKARLLRTPESYPAPRPRRASERYYLAAAVVRRGNRVAVVRGLDDGLLEDLWNFPSCFGRTDKAAKGSLTHLLGRLLPPLRLRADPAATVTHNITHRVIRVDIYPGELETRRPLNSRTTDTPRAQSTAQESVKYHAKTRWVSLSSLRNASISRLAQKIAEAVEPPSSH